MLPGCRFGLSGGLGLWVLASGMPLDFYKAKARRPRALSSVVPISSYCSARLGLSCVLPASR